VHDIIWNAAVTLIRLDHGDSIKITITGINLISDQAECVAAIESVSMAGPPFIARNDMGIRARGELLDLGLFSVGYALKSDYISYCLHARVAT
jgi:hypothetical protein